MESNDTTQLKKTEEKLLSAMRSGDIKALNALLHDDLLFVIPTGETVTKQIDLANYESGKLKISHLSSSDQEINRIGDNAIVSVIIDLKGKYLDQAIDGSFKYIRIWKLFGDVWKVIGGAGIQL